MTAHRLLVVATALGALIGGCAGGRDRRERPARPVRPAPRGARVRRGRLARRVRPRPAAGQRWNGGLGRDLRQQRHDGNGWNDQRRGRLYRGGRKRQLSRAFRQGRYHRLRRLDGQSGNGRLGAGGAAGTGAAAGSSGPPYALKNPPVPSTGCGKATTVKSGKKYTITSGEQQRSYIIDIPTNYDMNKPYRFFYTSHWISSTAEAVQQQNFYFLKPLATAANEPAIFLAPQALPGNPNGTWDTSKNTDHILFDDLLAYVKAESVHRHHARLRHRIQLRRHDDVLALRESPEGHSRGGRHRAGQLQHLRAHQDSPAHRLDANHRDERHDLPVGQWDQHDPGREVHRASSTAPTTGAWSRRPSRRGRPGAHLCVDFTGCMTGAPTKVCTFNGPHTNINSDPGSSANWIPAGVLEVLHPVLVPHVPAEALVSSGCRTAARRALEAARSCSSR